MKKLIALIGILMSMYPSIYAEEHGVFMEINMRNMDSYTKVNRAPKRISLDVVYDTETKTVTVTGDESISAEVFIYNASGEVENHSSSLNTTLSVSSLGNNRIRIEGEDWIANGVIEIE